jgi:hypothetical protein
VLPPINLVWSGGGEADVTATSISGLSAGIFNFTGTVPVTDSVAFPIQGLAMNGGTNGVGLGGNPIIVVGDSLVLVTLHGNQWTTGTRSIQVASDAATPDVPKFITQSGSPLDASGHIKLISPTTLSTNIGASATLPMFAIMELQFEQVVPEPGTLLLLASGVAGLAMVGRKRMSK